MSRAAIRELRERGIDVLSVPKASMLGALDEENLAFALAEGRVIFTQDADFLRLAAAGHEHAGFANARQGTSVGDIIQGLMLIVQVLDAGEMKGKFEYL